MWDFKVFEWIDGTQGDQVGAADNVASATSIATAYFISRQAASTNTHYGVVVANSTGGYVAVIGKIDV